MGTMVQAPCSHRYCVECIVELFLKSTEDEGLMPPRCCTLLIPLASVQKHLYAFEVSLFESKKREFGTIDRLYCPTASCATFIGEASKTVRSIAQCPKCRLDVCIYCKAPQNRHSELQECTIDGEDPIAREVLELGERKGWRRCSQCRMLVELSLGW